MEWSEAFPPSFLSPPCPSRSVGWFAKGGRGAEFSWTGRLERLDDDDDYARSNNWRILINQFNVFICWSTEKGLDGLFDHHLHRRRPRFSIPHRGLLADHNMMINNKAGGIGGRSPYYLSEEGRGGLDGWKEHTRHRSRFVFAIREFFISRRVLKSRFCIHHFFGPSEWTFLIIMSEEHGQEQDVSLFLSRSTMDGGWIVWSMTIIICIYHLLVFFSVNIDSFSPSSSSSSSSWRSSLNVMK